MAAPQRLLESSTKVREMFDYLALLTPPAAEGLLRAIHPLLKLSMSLKDSLILVLRKAMFSRYYAISKYKPLKNIWFNLGSCKKFYFNLFFYNSQAVGFQKDRSLWVFNDFEKFPHPWWTTFKPGQPTFLIQPGKSFSSTCARVPGFTYLYDYTFMSVSKNVINWFCILFSLEIFAFALIFLSFMIH